MRKSNLSVMYSVMLELGAFMILASAVLYFLSYNYQTTMILLWSGLGLLIPGIYLIIRRKLNPELDKQTKYESGDERGVQVDRRALSFSWIVGYIFFLALAAVFACMGYITTAKLVAAAWVLYMLSYFAAKAYFNKKM